MKRILAILLAFMLAAALFAGCGATSDDGGGDDEVTTTAAEIPGGDETPTEAPTEALNDPPSVSLADWLAEVNAELAEANAASGGMFNIEVKMEGDKLVYVYTFGMDLPADALQPYKDAAGQAYGGLIGSYKGLGYGINAIEIRFLDGKGKVIDSAVFE